MLEREMAQRTAALDEHKRVLKQMAPLEPTRRAMQNVAGVLVPRTVADASAELQTRVDTLLSSLNELTQQHNAKADALRSFMADNHLRITASDNQFSAIPRQLDPDNASKSTAAAAAAVTN
jgi:flagellar biosynthesis/type III secretory pathway chaperone